ncbi:hypothetical protein AK812_SmicGene24802 [Symbiodinium microadriaticum]|uniref:Uncharacterized protein n=1 Tax=Symbiodinium microadriaticum TaxID=2951 RepID=A0A1Q9DDR9_SYMMI|nr:hypothetical protein AK812_SmicGene24802 [Symbiodinium microadriaticum]
MSVRATSQCSWGRPPMHLADGTGRDWYILGDTRMKNGRWEPPATKPMGRGISELKTGCRSYPTKRRPSPEKKLQTLSLSRNVQKRPPSEVIERWRQQADYANSLSRTPSLDVDPSIRLPEAPTDAYSYFSDNRMVRRIAFSGLPKLQARAPQPTQLGPCHSAPSLLSGPL